MVALAWLPASVFVVASSTDITFNTILSRVFLKKRFSTWHYIAAVLATGGMIVVAASNGQDGEYVCDGDTCIDDYAPGLGCSVAAAVLVAANAVISESLLKAHKASGPLGAVEAAMFYSIIPMLLTPLVALVTGEIWLWPDRLGSVGKYGSVTAFGLLCVGALLSKLLARVCRFQVVRAKGAFFFSIVNALVRLGTAVIAIFGEIPAECSPLCEVVQLCWLLPCSSPSIVRAVLNESFNWNKGVAIGIVTLALLSYLRGSFLNLQHAGLVRRVAGTTAAPGKSASTALLPDSGVDSILSRGSKTGGESSAALPGGTAGRSMEWLFGAKRGGYGTGRQAVSLGDLFRGFDGHEDEVPVDDEPWGMTLGGLPPTAPGAAEEEEEEEEEADGVLA
jgi:drug/metabolite transporter (DMT)-like permease